MSFDTSALDLDAYLDRIGLKEPIQPDLAGLQRLHLAHATRIPFENIDALLKRPIRLDLESLQQKLVNQRRGGYCFEQNLLFAAALERLGFSVTRLGARVRYRTTRILPRTHMLLNVDIGEEPWLADVGFGGGGLLHPVPIVEAKASRQFAWTYRTVREGESWVLQSQSGGDWNDLYVFTMEPQHLVDYEMANYYVSTFPESRFVQTLTVQLPLPDERLIIRNHELVTERPEGIQTLPISGDDELLDILEDTFHLKFPAGTRFPIQAPQSVA